MAGGSERRDRAGRGLHPRVTSAALLGGIVIGAAVGALAGGFLAGFWIGAVLGFVVPRVVARGLERSGRLPEWARADPRSRRVS